MGYADAINSFGQEKSPGCPGLFPASITIIPDQRNYYAKLEMEKIVVREELWVMGCELEVGGEGRFGGAACPDGVASGFDDPFSIDAPDC